jgi:hypothetical protein
MQLCSPWPCHSLVEMLTSPLDFNCWKCSYAARAIVPAWWKLSPHPLTGIVGNAAMKPGPLSRLGGNSHLTFGWNCWKCSYEARAIVPAWWKLSPHPLTGIVGNAAMKPGPLSRLGGNSHLSFGWNCWKCSYAARAIVPAWWKLSPHPLTGIVGNADMQPAPLSRLGGNALLTPTLKLLEMQLCSP